MTLIIRPEFLEGTLRLLDTQGVEPLSVTNVEGVGRQRGHAEIYRGGEYEIQTLPKVRIDLLVEDSHKRDEVVENLSAHLRTGRVGDGKIFVFHGESPMEVQETAFDIS